MNLTVCLSIFYVLSGRQLVNLETLKLNNSYLPIVRQVKASLSSPVY